MAAPPTAESIALLERFVAALKAQGVVTEEEIADRSSAPTAPAPRSARAWSRAPGPIPPIAACC